MADNTAELGALLVDDVPVVATQLSALVDDQLADREIDLVLRRLSRDDDARSRWERYHLISDVIQGHLPAAFDTDFAARVRRAIEAEPLPQPVGRPLPAWYKPVTGFGLAASVALVALFGLKLNQTDILQPAAPFAITPTTLSSPTAALPIQTVATTQPLVTPAREPVETRLTSYLVNHNGYASMNSVSGMLPYVRMVGYQPQPGR
ncbi:MAG: sigma-E factor negative regulatory protein [Candidatus Contendobacter sp.]|nr:sigma-E factor negative regulatory protein [Candidatus Contendobacter sp.]